MAATPVIGTDGACPVAVLIAAAGDFSGTTIGTFTNMDTDSAVATATDNTTTVAATAGPTLTTLVSFNGTGGDPISGLIADAAGDLFGTTYAGGAYGDGTVFEVATTGGGYASTPTILASFNGTDGQYPEASLIADAAGDLFGTTSAGGAYGSGTVFEIAKTGSGYASTPTTLVNFSGYPSTNGNLPLAGLVADAAGDLFGTTYQGGASFQLGGSSGYGTVFEIAKTGTGYASTPITLVSFNGANGAYPYAALIADAAGDLFGTTELGGAYTAGSPDNLGYGTVFEIAKGRRRLRQHADHTGQL